MRKAGRSMYLRLCLFMIVNSILLFVMEKTLIGDKLAYRGSLSASLSQELIAAYPWLAYPVAYPVAASRRCGQRLGGGRRLGNGGASEPVRRLAAWRPAARRRRRRPGNGGVSESVRRLLVV